MSEMDKKAAVNAFVYLLATFFIIVILVLFVVLTSYFNSNALKVSEPLLVKEKNLVSIFAFLQTQTEWDGQNITMADLLRLHQMNTGKVYNIDLYRKVQAEPSSIFRTIYGSVGFNLMAGNDGIVQGMGICPDTMDSLTLPSFSNIRLIFAIHLEKCPKEVKLF